ncbi:MAG: metal ABC transporter permease [Desulfobacterales bacterium]|jgi:zinc transport system permease protein
MFEALQFEFMRNALLAGLMASIICGIIGTLVVVNRIVFMAGGIAHAAYGGIGLSFFFGWPYLAGTVGFSFVAAVIMAAVTLRMKHRSDTVIGVIWAAGMAIGIVLLDLTPGYNVDLMSYLFGSILAVPRSDLLQMFIASCFLLFLLLFYYRGFLAMSYDEEFARLRGVPVVFLYFLMIGMVAVSVVITIRVVGLILVIALLTIPPFIAEKYVRSLGAMMVISGALSAVFTYSGLWLSYSANLTSGAAIILVAAACFFAVIGIEWLRNARKRNRGGPETASAS